MTINRRERQRAATIDEIKQTARQHMAEDGAASLSLRAIARDMGLTSPALYRYFASRDDLVTALIVDAFNSLANSQKINYEENRSTSFMDRMLALAENYRAWALQHPELYTLLFGTPIPNYHAPPEITRPSAEQAMAPFIQLVTEAHTAGVLTYPAPYKQLTPEFKQKVTIARQQNSYGDFNEVILFTMTGWGRIHGLVSLELYNRFQPIIHESGDLFRLDMLTWLQSFGLD